MSALLDARMGLISLQVWRPKPLFPVHLGREKGEKPSVMGSILCHSYAHFGPYFPMPETGYAVEGCVVASSPAHVRACCVLIPGRVCCRSSSCGTNPLSAWGSLPLHLSSLSTPELV